MKKVFKNIERQLDLSLDGFARGTLVDSILLHSSIWERGCLQRLPHDQ